MSVKLSFTDVGVDQDERDQRNSRRGKKPAALPALTEPQQGSFVECIFRHTALLLGSLTTGPGNIECRVPI